MKKIITYLLFAISVVPLLFVEPSAKAAYYTPSNLNADIAYLISADGKTEVVDVNSEKRAAPASITKVVTAILTLENCRDLEQKVTAPQYAIRLLDGTNSSTAGIKVGEELTVRQLLYCLLLASGNDAANVLADYIGGGIDNFVAMMNDFAAKLELKNTHFANAHGLDDDNHYTTASDLAVIYSYCLKNSAFAEIAGTASYIVPATNLSSERILVNTDGLLDSSNSEYYLQYAKNGKTGTTANAGRCLISFAEKDGNSYICVVLNAPYKDYDGDGVNENMAFIDSRNLYIWAFDNMSVQQAVGDNFEVTSLPVGLAKKAKEVALVPSVAVSALLPNDADLNKIAVTPIKGSLSTDATAPIEKGTILGKATVEYDGQVIAEIDLTAEKTLEKSFFKSTAKWISEHKVLVIMILIAILILISIAVIRIRAERERKRKIEAMRRSHREQRLQQERYNRRR